MDKPEMIEDKEYVTSFLESCVEIVGVSMIAGFGVGPELPPFLYVARAPGFDFTGIPGMGDEGARSSSSDWRWGLLNNLGELWATLELWWPGDIQRQLKVNLQKTARNMFPMLTEMAPSGIADLGISNEEKGIPETGLLGVQIDVTDGMFRAITSWVKDQPPPDDDPGHSG